MTTTILDTDSKAATLALKQWREGAHVDDDWYRYMLKEHGKGAHRGQVSGLCPACAAE